MRSFKAFIAAASCAAILGGGVASAQIVVDFDDLVGQATVPSNYKNIDWPGWWYFDFAQAFYPPHSPPTRIYNTTSHVILIGRDVEFHGAWMAGHGSNIGQPPVGFQLYRGGDLVHTGPTVDLGGTNTTHWVASDYTGAVDEVRVVGGEQGLYVLDDFTYDELGGLRISVSGSCPGLVTVEWRGATASTTAGLVFARNQGSFTITGGPCDGTQLGLGSNQIQLVRQFNTGPNGSGQLSGNAGVGACGGFLQVVVADGRPCDTSNVGQIP